MTGRRLLLVALFAAAMGYLESAVVVYLRLIFYPHGFEFPLVPLPSSIAAVEVAREAATLLMLLAVAGLAGRTCWSRFAWLCVLFGIWDIVYYVGLKASIGWPASLLTWDILFLIPLIWAGPVLAPVITSIALIAGGLLILDHERRGHRIHVHPVEWGLELVALGLQLYAFMANHGRVAAGGLPAVFPWVPFLLGVALGLGTLVRAVRADPRSLPVPPPGSRS